MTTVKLPLTLCLVFLWIGFVCSISFMEAWLKFRATGVTIPIGLSIGRLVFNALNKVEWVFAIAIFAEIIFSKSKVFTFQNIFYFIPLTVIILQTFLLLPQLDTRAELLIQQQYVPPSNLHFYYVGIEVLKVICLFIFGILLFKPYHILPPLPH